MTNPRVPFPSLMEIMKGALATPVYGADNHLEKLSPSVGVCLVGVLGMFVAVNEGTTMASVGVNDGMLMAFVGVNMGLVVIVGVDSGLHEQKINRSARPNKHMSNFIIHNSFPHSNAC